MSAPPSLWMDDRQRLRWSWRGRDPAHWQIMYLEARTDRFGQPSVGQVVVSEWRPYPEHTDGLVAGSLRFADTDSDEGYYVIRGITEEGNRATMDSNAVVYVMPPMLPLNPPTVDESEPEEPEEPEDTSEEDKAEEEQEIIP